jgi:hypothetical protein
MKGLLLLGGKEKRKPFLADDEEEKSADNVSEYESEEERQDGDKVLAMAEAALSDPKALLKLIDARVKACMTAGE